MPTLTLEETIRALANAGNLSSISISMNSSYTKWRASYAPTKVFGVAFAEDDDPVKAILLAIGKRPSGLRNPRVEPIKQKTVDVEALDATGQKSDPAPDATGQPLDADIDALM
jgi:hypothetical protein